MHFILLALMFFQSPHSVQLNWNASPDQAANPTLSYNIYKAPTACTNTPVFTKLAATAADALTFTDSSVSVGQSLCYQVTSVLNGLESVPSNSVTAVILPGAPSSLVEIAK
jgi:hypothetical protein